MTRLDLAVLTSRRNSRWSAILPTLCIAAQMSCGSSTLDQPGSLVDGRAPGPDADLPATDARPDGSFDASTDGGSSVTADASPHPVADGGVLVGYWPNWSDLNIYSLEHAAEQGYNLLVIAFGRLEGTTADVVYLASIDQSRRDAIKADIIATKNAYPDVRIILSVGGANNTYSPSAGDAQLDIAAQNIVDLLHEYDLDGIDFDVEYSTGTIVPLAQKLRQLDAGMLITAAPQVNYDERWMLVTTGWSEDYAAGIDQELFDYLFLQEYDAVFWGSPYQSNDPELIQAVYDELKTWVPESVRLVAGVPSTWRSASQASIHYADYTVQQTVENARPIATVTSLINQQVHAIRAAPGETGQFAGVMTWCTLDDAVFNTPPYAFAQGVADCIVNDNCD